MIALTNQPMNNRQLDGLIRQISASVEGDLGCWRFDYQGRQLMAITDETHNRMRVMTAIIDGTELTEEIRHTVLEANFDRALDAKYATSQGYLWSVFTHPLAELTDDQFLDAVAQVKTLADNFGTSYSSCDLVFGDG